MEFIPNSYGYLVPKEEYEELQIEVDKMNEIRLNGLTEFNKFLEKIGIEPVSLDGLKPSKELTKTDSKGSVLDARIKRFPPPYKNPYDFDFDYNHPDECKRIMVQRIQNFRQLKPENRFSDIPMRMKDKFVNKLEYFVSQSVNPIRFKLLDKVKNMNVEDFIKIHFSWYNNIAGVEVFHVNYVINQWASYFEIETEIEYDSMTGEDKETIYKNMPKISFGVEDELDKQIRRHFYGFYDE